MCSFQFSISSRLLRLDIAPRIFGRTSRSSRSPRWVPPRRASQRSRRWWRKSRAFAARRSLMLSSKNKYLVEIIRRTARWTRPRWSCAWACFVRLESDARRRRSKSMCESPLRARPSIFIAVAEGEIQNVNALE